MTAYYSQLELAIFKVLNFDGGPFFDGFFTVVTDKWFGIALGLLAALWIAWQKRWDVLRFLAVLILAIGLTDFIGSYFLKPFFGRMRPCYALAEGSFRWIVRASDVGALPSLHSANLFAWAYIVFRADKRLTIPAYILAALVAYSRIYVGVHWPTDTLAGAAWGTAMAMLFWWLSGLVEGAIKRKREKRADLESQ
ncbi:phosphatase PAP2 family protein [bacterium]|nr:phosphatase PAP2 family protein [bacterium]